MPEWKRRLLTSDIVVRAVYGCTIIYMAVVWLKVGNIELKWDSIGPVLFGALMVITVVEFAFSIWFGRRAMGRERLEQVFSAEAPVEQRLLEACRYIQTGSVVMAALGEAVALYGLVIYLVTGSPTHPWYFFLLSGLHYMVTMRVTGDAKAVVEEMSGRLG